MGKKYVIEVQEVWLVKRKYYSHNDTADEAIEAYKDGTTVEAFEDYDILEKRYSEKFENGYDIIEVYED